MTRLTIKLSEGDREVLSRAAEAECRTLPMFVRHQLKSLAASLRVEFAPEKFSEAPQLCKASEKPSAHVAGLLAGSSAEGDAGFTEQLEALPDLPYPAVAPATVNPRAYNRFKVISAEAFAAVDRLRLPEVEQSLYDEAAKVRNDVDISTA